MGETCFLGFAVEALDWTFWCLFADVFVFSALLTVRTDLTGFVAELELSFVDSVTGGVVVLWEMTECVLDVSVFVSDFSRLLKASEDSRTTGGFSTSL